MDAGGAGSAGTGRGGAGSAGGSGGQAGDRSTLSDAGPLDAGGPIDAAPSDAAMNEDAQVLSDAAADAAAPDCLADMPADCFGVCGGDAVVDSCGVCDGNDAAKDCAGVCNGSAVPDDCGDCDGDNAAKDCAGVCDGSSELDCLGQCGGGAACSVPALGALIVSEVMFNSVTVDDTAGEWFELYNVSDHALELQGCTIADNAASVPIDVPLQLPVGGFATFARGSSPGFSPSFDFGTNTLQLSNTSDEIVVTCGSVAVETFAYTAASFASMPGASLSIAPAALSAAAHTDAANWCSGSVSYNGDLGTPGSANPSCAPVAPTAAGDLVISELMANPNATLDDVGEWFELYNPSLVPLELNGCLIRDDDQDEHPITSSFVIPPHSFRTLAASASPGFVPSYVYPRADFQLANGPDEVVVSCGGTEIDRVDYDATFIIPVGRSLALDAAKLTAAQNDTASAWCNGATVFNVDYGTPNVANPACE